MHDDERTQQNAIYRFIIFLVMVVVVVVVLVLVFVEGEHNLKFILNNNNKIKKIRSISI